MPSRNATLQPEFHMDHRWAWKVASRKRQNFDDCSLSFKLGNRSDERRSISLTRQTCQQYVSVPPRQAPKANREHALISHQPYRLYKEALSATRPKSQGLRAELTLMCFLEAPPIPVPAGRFFPFGTNRSIYEAGVRG